MQRREFTLTLVGPAAAAVGLACHAAPGEHEEPGPLAIGRRIIERATKLSIDLYRDEKLHGFFEIGCSFGLVEEAEYEHESEHHLDRAEAFALIRELLAAFERKPAVFKSNADNKVSAV